MKQASYPFALPHCGLAQEYALAFDAGREHRLLLIPASAETAGHGTTGNARWYAKELGEWLAGVPRRGS